MEVLQFSGGLDSLACLELLKNRPGLTVLTVSTDGAYPERAEYLSKVAEQHPHLQFMIVHSQRQLGKFGRPVDVVPLKFTPSGSLITGAPLKYQPYYECCNRGLWQPMAELTAKLGATVVYRGQRAEDSMKSPIHDGHEENGVVYRFPIEDWTRQEVKDFVQARCPELIPEYYGREQTSRDCWDCTAYLQENKARIENLPAEQKASVSRFLNEWCHDVNEETRW